MLNLSEKRNDQLNIRSFHITIFLLAIIASQIHLPAWSQAPFIEKVRSGMAVNDHIFNTAYQDRSGFIWLGSDRGLFRFDGKDYKQIEPPADSVEFKVLSIHESPEGILWIGCKSGNIYHLNNGILSLFNPEEGTAGAGISDIITDKQGITWWSTLGEGIYFYSENRVYNFNHDDGLDEEYVYDILEDENGQIWAGTDAGVFICSFPEGKKSVQIPDFNDQLPDPIVKVLKKDRSGKIYLGLYESAPGFITQENKTFSSLSAVSEWIYGTVSDIEVLGDAVWIATSTGRLIETGPDGLVEIDPAEEQSAASGRFGKIYELLKDHEGNVWIIAASGLFRTTGSRLRFYNRIGNVQLKDIHAITVDLQNEKCIWFSNEEGLFKADLLTGKTKKYLESQAFENLKVTCLSYDPYGYMWAGTFNYGVFRIDPSDGKWTRITEKEGLVNDNVLSISVHNDTLWMATLGGATEIILNTQPPGGIGTILSFNRSNGLVSNYIYSVYEDKRDRIWFATDGDGISVLDRGKFTSYSKEQGLGDDVIYSISGDQYGNAWIATASAGVYRFDGSQFIHYGPEEGLSGQQITGLKTTGEEVVVILENGLDVIHIPTGRIVHYGEEVGMGSILPDLNTVSKDPAGNLWIGTKKGILRYQPGFSNTTSGPVTVLAQMAVFLDPIEMKEDLVLGSRENHITFTYNGIWLSNPEKVNFQVMLTGFDIDWKNTFDPSAIYSSLPPGKYTFRVRSSINPSFINASEESYQFTIRQPVWKNPLFIFIIAILIVLLILLWIRSREKKLRRIELEKKEKVEFEFQLLKNQVNPHFLFNSFSTLMALIEEQPRQAIEYTEKLSDFFRIILQLKDEEVIHLKEELTIIDDYFFLLKKRFGENIDLDINIEDEILKSSIPPMTLQILIENAVKHNIISKDKPLRIKIYSTKKQIIIENNLQPKITKEVSTGIGLENIFKRYRLKTDKVPEIEKNDKLFKVILPVIPTTK
jgi:ligand-binding sensor domain-containing protein